MTTGTIDTGKVMAAKFSGKCRVNGCRIFVGQTIVWSRAGGPRCAECAGVMAIGASEVTVPAVDPNCGKNGGCEAHDGECDPRNGFSTNQSNAEYVFTPCWAGGRCEDAPCCGCGQP